jgi:cation diffusion facilitator CzcD-associated flavoprotein CzcO
MTAAGPAALPSAWPASGHLRAVVIGAGFGGLAVAHRLRTEGITDFIVLDRGTTVGGTWRDNTYPGCGCDVASHLYSFSFAPNPDWSRSFSRQPEIHRYLQRVVQEHDLERFLVLGTEVQEVRWDDDAACWRISTSRGPLSADILIGATGPLSVPLTPALPGLSQFPGPVFHTAQWRHDVDLTGKRVAVVGTGASAIQVIPQIQPLAKRLTVFQRTPPWVMPKADRTISRFEQAAYRRFPLLQRLARAGIYTFREGTVAGFVVKPALLRAGEEVAKAHLRRHVKDSGLRRALTPRYRLGCKRVLPSNDYYPAITKPNVDLVPAAITRFEGQVAVAADGTRHELDVVVLGTGFEIADLPVGHLTFGKDGRSLAQVWAESGRSALRLTTVAGFPNMFMVLGPNAGLGHSSMIYVIESQAAYIVDAIQAMTARRLAAIEPDVQAQGRYNTTLQRRMRRTVWTTGGCASWYQDPDGKVTVLWPGSTLRLRHDTRRVDLSEYTVRLAGPGHRTVSTASTTSTASQTSVNVGGSA